MSLLGIVLPAAAVALLLRRYFSPLPWRVIAICLALTLGFLHGALFPSLLPVPVDEVARGYPFRAFVDDVQPRNPLTNDTVKQILPWMQVVREELFSGRAPLWNRYQFSGYPLLANGQSAPFAPTFLATLFVPLPHQIVAMAGLKIFLALIFGWLFLRDEGVSEWAALFGSSVFAFSVFQTVYLYYPLTAVTSLFPAAAFATLGCVRYNERRWIVLLALVTAAAMSSGHPESALHIAIGCGILLLIERRNPTRAFGAALLGLGLAAPAWVPVAQQALRSVRAAALAAAPRGAMDANMLWLFLNPDGFGNPSRGNWQWIYNYAIVAPTYVGLLPLALLAAARRGRELALVISGAALFLVAMNWTFLGRAINSIPPLSLAAQDRLRFVIVFFVAIVAARAVDRIVVRFAVASVILLLGAVWLLQAKWNITLGWPTTVGVIALLLFWIVAAIRRDLAPIAACVVMVIELFVFNAGFNALTKREYYRPKLPILTRLKELSKGEPSRIVGHDWTFLPNSASQYGFEDVRGHDPMALASYASFFKHAAVDDPSSDVARVQFIDSPEVSFLGVRFLITDPTFNASDLWQLRHSGADGKLYERKVWTRRFFVTRSEAKIEKIVQESPTRLSFEVDAPGETFVASNQVWTPDWRVEGGTMSLLHDAFIGILVPAGRHTVILTYRPMSFYASLGVTLLSLLALVITCLTWNRFNHAQGAALARSSAPSPSP